MALFVNQTPDVSYDLRPLFAGGAISSNRVNRFRNEYIIHYILRGNGFFVLDGKEYPVSKGQMFIIKPNEKATYYPADTTDWQYAWIGFDGEYAKRLYELPCPVIKVNAEPFGAIYLAANSKSESNDFYVARLYDIFSLIFPKDNTKKSLNDYAAMARAYIEMRFCDDISIELIAEELHVDKCYLSRSYKKKYGQTPKATLTNLRMIRAVELMSKGYSAKTSAAMVGYGNESAFYIAFKKHFGTTPRLYLEKIQP